MTLFKLIAASFLLYFVTAKDVPRFLGPATNVTVVVGRDATLTCKMDNLHSYKVAWLRVDTQTILTIGPHVITKNHRVGVSRPDPQTWALAVRAARPGDGGRYMCQVNTEPMITQTHHLQVVVPPDIVDSGSSGEVMVREGDSVNLHCAASGTPKPTITWRREDSAHMRINGKLVSKWSGVWLNMSEVVRASNGAFLCIATNGVPPTVSKRIMLHVLCVPSVWAVQNTVGGFVGTSVQLQCTIEANPPPAVYWTHINTNRLQEGSKYQSSMTSEGYRHIATLVILNVSRDDIGVYHCFVENSLGKASAAITFYTLAVTTSSTTLAITTTTVASTAVVMTTDFLIHEHIEENGVEKKVFSEDDNYVVVLSQHQLQNIDVSASS